MMKLILVVTAATLVQVTLVQITQAQVAQALEVQSCRDAGVGLESLVLPVAKNTREFAQGKIQVYKVDQGEPVCCSVGVAVVIPDVDSELGDSKCVSVMGLGDVDVKNAAAKYDSARGLKITFATRKYNPETGGNDPAENLHLRVNLKRSTVQVER